MYMAKKRILVIDDEKLIRDGVAEVLQDEGYDVIVAADGVEALALLPSYQPHLVLTDLQMPRLDGFGVIDHVKKFHPTLPVMIFTADITLDAQRTAEILGAEDYLNKPFLLDDMLVRVSQVFARHGKEWEDKSF